MEQESQKGVSDLQQNVWQADGPPGKGAQAGHKGEAATIHGENGSSKTMKEKFPY